YLVLSGSASDWFLWTVRWAWIHEREYPHFPWFTTALPFLRDSSWLLLLCLAGWITELRAGERDVLLLLALPSTLLSFAAQRAPFEYSLIPFIGIAVIFAARGVAALVNVRNRVLTAAVAFVCAAGMAADVPRTFQAAIPSNDAQLATLTRLGMATAPNDAVYDNTGAYFARPNAWYFFYTDEVLRRRLFSTMTIEVEEALRRTQAPAILIDLRFRGLPPRLQAFLLEHYQPYFGDLRLWGMRFGPAASVDAQFWAIRDGEYFVYPNTTLLVDGQAVTTGIVRLRAGPHRVVFSGKPAAFALLWLPRDGKPYVPSSSPAPNVFSDL
ncbi:MAG TPA: hypothetical protein VL284_17790, partial [Thermoanaerobaculia bacterium]|nr:hypothetical protein [Thermoanaerobaculia bacterium]